MPEQVTVLDIRESLVFEGTAHIGRGSRLVISKGAKLELGDNFAISASSYINCYKHIRIGKDCQLSWGDLLMDGDAHVIYGEDGSVINGSKEIILEDKIWIGCNCKVLKGAFVPNKCVVGANSIVTAGSKLQENSLIIGSPAKSVRKIKGFKSHTVNKNKKSRILFVGTLPPPVHGSAVVSQQIKDSKLINESFRCDWVNLGTSRSMDEIGKRTLAKPFRLVGALAKEFWLLMTRHYDLCYLAITCHGNGFLKDSPFVLMAKLFRKKIVIHQHNKGMANDVNRWPYRWLLPLCYKNAKVILLSWYLYPDIEKVVPKENVVICPNGIRVQEFFDERSDKVDYKRSRVQEKAETNRVPRLLFLSNLIESKGVFVLLDALKILKDKGYSFVCDFVGGETKEIDTKRFDEEIEMRDLNEIAIYRGRKYGDEKEEAFEHSDIFVLPTMNDCFPLVLLEAMEHGKPVVTTPIGGIPDIVNNGINGLLCNEANSLSLAEVLEKLIADSELCVKMGQSGRKRLELMFAEEIFEKRMKEMLWTFIN